MRTKFAVLLFSAYCLFFPSGCVVTTNGDASWEIYCGIRTKQHSKEPSTIELKSKLIEKVIDSFVEDKTNGTVGDDIINAIIWSVKWHFGVPSLLNSF